MGGGVSRPDGAFGEESPNDTGGGRVAERDDEADAAVSRRRSR